MLDLIVTYGPKALEILLLVLGAAVAVLHILAPLTKSTKDDVALGFLQRAMGFLVTVLGKLLPKNPPAPVK